MAFTSPIHGSRVALLGTSLVQQNHFAAERIIGSSARGWATWAEVLSHGQLDIGVFHDPLVHAGWEPSGRAGVTRGFGGLNAGVSGQKARDIAARIDDVLALDFDLIIVDAGTNDMMVETKEVIQAFREDIAARLLNAGKLVILLPILARSTEKWPAGGAERAKAHWINQRSLAFAARNSSCHIFDWNGPWVDRNSTYGVPQAGFSDDGTHFSVPGGYAVGKALAEYLRGFLAPRVIGSASPDDCFDAIHNPLGNIVAYQAREVHGTGTRELGVENGLCILEFLDESFISPLPAGAWVRGRCQVHVDRSEGWRDISLMLEDCSAEGLTAQALAPFALPDGDPAPYPDEAWSGVLTTPPIKLKAASTRLRLALNLRTTHSAHAPRIKFSDAELRQVIGS